LITFCIFVLFRVAYQNSAFGYHEISAVYFLSDGAVALCG